MEEKSPVEDLQEQIDAIMSSESEQPSEEAVVESAPAEASEDSEYSDIEKQAMEQGWVPPDKYNGPAEDAVSAEVYIARGPLMAQLKKQKKELEDLKNTMHKFKEQFTKAEERAFEKAKAELEAKMESAVYNADMVSFQETKRELEGLKKPTEQSVPQGPDPLVVEFIETHKWFSNPQTDEDYLMKSLAEGASTRFAQTRQGSVEDELTFVLETVKTQFPGRFKAPAKQKGGEKIPEATPVSSVGSKAAVKPTGRPKDWASLPEDVRNMATDLVKAGIYKTEAEYVEELRKVRGL